MANAGQMARISQMVFHGRCLEIHPYASGCISRSCTQHQGGRCRVFECWVDQKGRIDKRSIKHPPSTMQVGEDYTVNKLYLAAREMKKLFKEDRLINSLIVPAVLLFWLQGYMFDSRHNQLLFNYIRNKSKVQSGIH